MAYKQRIFFTIFFLSIAALGSGCQNKLEQRQKDAAASGTPYSPLVRIADSMKDSQDYATAVKLYRQALDMDPKDVDAQMGLARSLAALGQYKKSIGVLERVLAKREHSGALRELGKIYLVSNEPDSCIDAYSRVLRKDTQDIPSLNGMGVCHDIKGNHKQAQELYQKALALSPDHWGVKSNLGLSLVLEGKYDTGVSLLSSAADRPNATQRDRQNLAMALGLSGDVEKAAQLYSVDLREEDVRRNLAMFHVYKKAEEAPKTLALRNITEADIAEDDITKNPIPEAAAPEIVASADNDTAIQIGQVNGVY
ncbi:MAG: tetratricopeptide repeat protein [Pseudomonadota bacterium]